MKKQLNDSKRTRTHTDPSDEAIAIHVLRYLTTRQMNGAQIRFDKLRRHLDVGQLRLVRILGRLDRQGLLDCSRLRLTLHGFAIGMSLKDKDLPQLHGRAA